MKSRRSFPFVEIIIAVLLFLLLRPSFTWTWNVLPIQYLLFFLLAFQFDFKEKNNIALFFFFVLIVSIIPIAHGNNVFGIVTFVILTAFIPFVRKESMLKTLDIYKYIVACVLSISIAVWFAVVVFQVQLPSSTIEPLNELKDYDYLSYPFLVMPLRIQELALVRFCSVFDEPGVVGTMSLLFLYIGDFQLKRFENIIFLIAGFISFSLFFILGFFILLISKVFLDRDMKKYRLLSIIGVVVLIVSVLSIPVFNEMVGYRLEYDKDEGTIVGNNRSGDDLDNYIDSIRGTDKYLWGDSKAEEEYSNHASLQNAILRYGMVFMVLFFVFYFFYAKLRLHNKWVEIGLFMLLLFMTLYQRPGFVSPTYLFMFSCAVQVRQVKIEDKLKLLKV